MSGFARRTQGLRCAKQTLPLSYTKVPTSGLILTVSDPTVITPIMGKENKAQRGEGTRPRALEKFLEEPEVSFRGSSSLGESAPNTGG